MTRTHSYRAHVVWTGAKDGPTRSYAGYSREYEVRIEGKPTLTGSAEPAFRGDPKLPNPEDLLVAALSACHMLSYLALCTRHQVEVVAYEDAAEGEMETGRGGGHFTRVVLRPHVTIGAGSDAAKARELHDAAHDICFIASSVNFEVSHEAVIETA